MDLEERIKLVVRRPVEEVITFEELRQCLEVKSIPVAYDGFEGSGIPHLATGLLKVLKVKDFTDAGCKFILFLADWHSMVNQKLNGDFEKIRAAYNLFIEVWKSLMQSLNVKMELVKFKFGSEVYDEDYWRKVLEIAQKVSLHRAVRCLTIAGRKAAEAQALAMFFYIPMQVADIFHTGVDICQLGMDQRRANILAREIGESICYGAVGIGVFAISSIVHILCSLLRTVRPKCPYCSTSLIYVYREQKFYCNGCQRYISP